DHAVWRGRLVAEAGEVRGLAISAESHCRVAAEVILAGAGDVWIVRVLRNPGHEAVRQSLGPASSAIRRRVHATAVVLVPRLVTRQHDLRVDWIHREGCLVLRRGV